MRRIWKIWWIRKQFQAQFIKFCYRFYWLRYLALFRLEAHAAYILQRALAYPTIDTAKISSKEDYIVINSLIIYYQKNNHYQNRLVIFERRNVYHQLEIIIKFKDETKQKGTYFLEYKFAYQYILIHL